MRRQRSWKSLPGSVEPPSGAGDGALMSQVEHSSASASHAWPRQRRQTLAVSWDLPHGSNLQRDNEGVEPMTASAAADNQQHQAVSNNREAQQPRTSHRRETHRKPPKRRSTVEEILGHRPPAEPRPVLEDQPRTSQQREAHRKPPKRRSTVEEILGHRPPAEPRPVLVDQQGNMATASGRKSKSDRPRRGTLGFAFCDGEDPSNKLAARGAKGKGRR